jgi:aryl-alcohol dehydrogenase-like predicted oxidoreductase
MIRRKLGTANIDVSPICLGGNVFGWTADEQISFSLLDALSSAGFNFIDTADVYSAWVPGHKGGESETIIGNWLQKSGKRNKVIIATKVGMEVEGKKGLSKAHIFEAVEASLRRLKTDYIDLYQSHIDDETTSFEESLGAYQLLIEQGKVRAIGASNYNGKRLAESIELAKRNNLPVYQCLQPRYNLYDRAEFENDLLPVCKKYSLGVISYYALAAGFLSGKYRSEKDLTKSPRGARSCATYLNTRGLRILDALDRVAVDYKTSPTSVAIAWVMARPGITAPIASATNLRQLDEILAAAQLKLDSSAFDLLESVSNEVADAA